MRAPSVLAAVALAGTVLLGGAGQALAGEEDMGIGGSDFGSSTQAAPGFGQEASGSEQAAPEFGPQAFGSEQAAPEFGPQASGSEQDASGFGQGGSVFDLS